jgi:hypothetical protein
MKRNWHGSASPEEQFETWFNQQRQDMVLEGKNAPPTGPCPDEAFLKDLARKSRHIVLSDSRVAHAAACPLCMRKLLLFRGQRRSKLRRLVLTTAVVSCLFVAATIIWTVHRGSLIGQQENVAASVTTLDLSNAGTFRGDQPVPLQSVSLPASLVKVTIVLPRFSIPGRYVVAVTRDKTGSGPVAEGSAPAVSDGSREVVTVTMDLRLAKAGSYFLSTTREKDEASYYYPLDIR